MVSFEKITDIATKLGKTAGAESVLLFGSYARNQADDSSDIDFLVIAESDLPRHKRSRKLYSCLVPYDHSVDIMVYTPKGVEQLSSQRHSFISTILNDGKVLYEKH